MWYRVGDITESPNPPFFYCDRAKKNIKIYPSVHFCTRDRFVLIKSIYVQYRPGFHLKVYLQTDDFCPDNLLFLNLNFPVLYLRTDNDFNDFLSVVTKINLHRKKDEIPGEVVDEIKRIFYAFQSPSKVSSPPFSHKIPLHLLDSSPDLSSIDSFESLGERGRFLPPDDKEIAKENMRNDMLCAYKYLTAGANPNAVVHFGRLPLVVAVDHNNIELFKLLLFYYADPFLRGNDSSFMSAAEYMRLFKRKEMLNLMVVHFSNPEKPLKNLKVKQIKLMSDNHKIHTTFLFTNDKVIRTVLKKTSEIEADESGKLFQVFSQFFEIVNSKDNLKDIFTSSFTGKNKYVELIYEENKLIGFNLFEISDLKKYKDHKVVHGMISVIDPAYRGYGIMLILAFRLALVLQKILTQKVAFFFCSVHYNSYDPIRHLLHYPKYYNNGIRAIAYDTMKTLFDQPSEPLQEGITCFLEEALRVKGAFKLKSNNLFQDCFYEFILAITEKYPEIPRSAPIFIYITKQTTLHVQKVADSLDINLDCHLEALKELTVKVFPDDFVVHKSTNKLPSNQIFWQGSSEESANASESKEHEGEIEACNDALESKEVENNFDSFIRCKF